MTGARRTPLNRNRKPIVDDETLALFAKLETSDRSAPDFKPQDRELARRLGLHGEWFCSVVSVTDRDDHPCRGPEYLATQDWYKVRDVRNMLLEAARQRGYLPARQPASTRRDPSPTPVAAK
jgi:hypothetical protein